MAGLDREGELQEQLQRHEVLRLRGYTFALGPQGGLIVERWGHVRGVWRHDGERFAWTPASYAEPMHWAEDAASAVRYTIVMLGLI